MGLPKTVIIKGHCTSLLLVNAMKTHFFCALLLFVCSPSLGNDLTLNEYISQVKQANPTLRSAVLRAKALEHRIDPSGTLDDPFIAGGVDQIPFEGGMGSVTRYQISQTILFPGKLSAKSSAAENRANSAKTDAETFSREITVLATQAFYRLFYNQKALELNNRLKKIIESTVASTKARYKTGEAGHHDWLLAKIEQSIFEVEKLRLLREQKTIQAVANELRDQPVVTPIGILAPQFSNGDLKENELPSLENQPELKSLEFFVSQAENEKKLAKLSYFPDFVIQGMAMYPSPEMMDEKSNWGLMIGINLPLYFWRKQSELSIAASIDKEAAVLEKRNLENRLNSESLDAKEQFKTARDVAALYESTVIPTTNLAVQNAKSGYASRRLPLTQYLETLKVQRTQELEFLAAQIDVELARTRLKELLSSPPLLRLAPTKPSLFGGGTMGGGSMGSDTVNMGRGMSGPTRKSKGSSIPSESGSSGMGSM
jgi:outer membrane protein TolC